MLQELPAPEIFIGIVAPVGVDLSDTLESLSEGFRKHGYTPIHIKVTEVFKLLKEKLNTKSELDLDNSFNRINSYIEFGNEIRELFERNEILAASAIADILKRRRKFFGSNPKDSYSQRVYIINQLKRPEEVELLRKVYGALFFQISVYARRETRVSYIAGKCTKELSVKRGKTAESMAMELVAKDEEEAGEDFGQRVGKIFHTADFIVNTEIVSEPVANQVKRFCELLFGSNTISPTKLEYGMYAAKVAALRTLDLSRQVGAAIFSERGEIISAGSNEVPKGNGGSYWSDEGGIDAREYRKNIDTNDEFKIQGAREFYNLATRNLDGADSFDAFLGRADVKKAQVMDALEYGRIVHAEMTALMDASRNGNAVKGATLFTTTFPCHLCAKHIVASGINQVIYLEPYPKSLVSRLHSDSIQVDGADRGAYRSFPGVEFHHFYGITPRRYRELFERGKRKNKQGKVLDYIGDKPRPIVKVFEPSYSRLETRVVSAGLKQLYKHTHARRARKS